MSDLDDAARRVTLLKELEELERRRRTLEASESINRMGLTGTIDTPGLRITYPVQPFSEKHLTEERADIADQQKHVLAELGLLAVDSAPGDKKDGADSSPPLNVREIDMEWLASEKAQARKMYEAARQRAGNPTPRETRSEPPMAHGRFKLGPGLAFNDEQGLATKMEFKILLALNNSDSVPVDQIMRCDEDAAWDEPYTREKRDKIKAALRRLNNKLLSAKCRFEINLEREEIICRSI